MKIKLILILLLTITEVVTHIINQQYYSERAEGIWSNYIAANPQIGSDPSQYFLCGFAFRRKKWVYSWRDCHRCGFRRCCHSKSQDYYQMTNGFKAVFCNYANWNLKIQKYFYSNDEANAGWRDTIMCPAGYYANGYTARFGVARGADQGLTGLRLSCSPPTLSDLKQVEDGSGSQIADLKQFSHGNFISGFQIKYEPGWKFTGVTTGAQAMPLIVKIQLSYSKNLDINLSPLILDSATVYNYGSEKAEKRLKIQKTYEFGNTWTQQNKFVQGYRIQQSILSDFFLSKSKTSSVSYTQKSQSFSFGKQIKTIFTIDQQLFVFVPKCKKIVVNTIMKQGEANIPYSATLTFARLSDTGVQISTKRVQGIWKGTLTQSIQNQIREVTIPNCGNLRI